MPQRILSCFETRSPRHLGTCCEGFETGSSFSRKYAAPSTRYRHSNHNSTERSFILHLRRLPFFGNLPEPPENSASTAGRLSESARPTQRGATKAPRPKRKWKPSVPQSRRVKGCYVVLQGKYMARDSKYINSTYFGD